MKRVRYALGATAALTPAAIGMIPTTAAHAAADATTGASAKVKSVSLQHPSAPAAELALSGCTATSKHTVHPDSLIVNYSVWSALKKGYVCVGTQQVEREFKNHNCVTINFDVFYGHNDGNVSSRHLANRCGFAGSLKTFQSGFRKWYPIGDNEGSVEVCVSSNFTSTTCQFLGPGKTG